MRMSEELEMAMDQARNMQIADRIDALKIGHTIDINGHQIRRSSEIIYRVDGKHLTFIEAYYQTVEG